MTDYCRVRRFLGLTQMHVCHETGVTPQRLSQGERGRIVLNPTELRLIKNFLAGKLDSFKQNRSAASTQLAEIETFEVTVNA